MDKIIQWLMALIGFNTTTDSGHTEACAAYIAEELKKEGVDAKVMCCGPGNHVYARVPGNSERTLLLHAHMDTAGYGDPERWHFPSDHATRRRGCIFGRGTLDCKSQIAVWMMLLSDAVLKANGGDLSYTLALLVTDREEKNGEDGLKQLLEETHGLLSKVFLVIGEGGGFPFPFQDRMYYTFQTGEHTDEDVKSGAVSELKGPEEMLRILQLGIDLGYYSTDILDYCLEQSNITGRKLETAPLYEDMEDWFRNAPKSDVFACYGDVFLKALKEKVPKAALMPYITPGYSDNRWFRECGIPVIGFFPLDVENRVSGIHGPDEYISERSIQLAYDVMTYAVQELLGRLL